MKSTFPHLFRKSTKAPDMMTAQFVARETSCHHQGVAIGHHFANGGSDVKQIIGVSACRLRRVGVPT
jgi:hypothetical protein